MMSLMFDNFEMDIIVGIVTLTVFLFYWSQSTFDYWRKKGVRFLKPLPLFGNMLPLAIGRKSKEELFWDFYYHEEFKNEKFGGIFLSGKPVLVARDPDFIKQVLIKDFDHFPNRGYLIDAKKEPLFASLGALDGPEWQALRKILTPAFTSGKTKRMYNVMNECADVLEKMLEEAASKGEILDVKELLEKFAIDIFGTCAFGLEMNAMHGYDFGLRTIFLKKLNSSFIPGMKRRFTMAAPNIAKFLGIRHCPSERITNSFGNVTKQIVDNREKNNDTRNDFIQLLINVQNTGNNFVPEKSNLATEVSGSQSFVMNDSFIAVQALSFFISSVQAPSRTISIVLHELARNPDVEKKLATEIKEAAAKVGGKFTYDSINELKYLDMVIAEALRKYPIGFLIRNCMKDYNINGTDIFLDSNCKVFIPVLAIHKDPKYYPNPDKFIPERFTPEEKAKRHPSVYIPFGEGPRKCIGARFSILQTKIGLATAIKNYSFEFCEKTPDEKYFDQRERTGGVWLRVKKR